MGIRDKQKINHKLKLDNAKHNPFVSNTFKLWIVTFLFFIIFLHLYTVTYYSNVEIVSVELILSITLTLVAYLWIQELKDRHRLQLLNERLLDTQQRLNNAQFDTIAALVLTEEAKDPYMRGHSQMVAHYCLAIAKEMGLNGQKLNILERAAKLHDIGKLGIRDEILKKPGKLTQEEWAVIHEHPLRAIQILEPLRFLNCEKDIILYHHERYDGKGYPAKLKGKDTPLESRIMAVADTFDAMNSKRPYRDALSREVIISELEKASGTQLDPKVVKAFLDLLHRNPDLWKRDKSSP